MYLREDTRKNKDGSIVTYVRLAHNTRDPKTGRSKASILYNFGRKEHIDIPQLKRLIKSISRFLPPEDALEIQAESQSRGHRLKWQKCRSYGGIYFIAELWKKLNFDSLLSKHIRNRHYSTPIVQAIFAMVANPDESGLHAANWRLPNGLNWMCLSRNCHASTFRCYTGRWTFCCHINRNWKKRFIGQLPIY